MLVFKQLRTILKARCSIEKQKQVSSGTQTDTPHFGISQTFLKKQKLDSFFNSSFSLFLGSG
jgi:hypothetical protein